MHGGISRTPNIDRFATEGVELKRYYGYPLCSPSRAALLTGQMPRRYGITHALGPRDPGLPADLPTLPRTLQSFGYQTWLVGIMASQSWSLFLGMFRHAIALNPGLFAKKEDVNCAPWFSRQWYDFVFFSKTILTFCGSDYGKRVDFEVCSNFTHSILNFHPKNLFTSRPHEQPIRVSPTSC